MSNLIIIATVSTTATMYQCLIIQLATKRNKNTEVILAPTCPQSKEIISMDQIQCRVRDINKIKIKYKQAITAARNSTIIIETNVPNACQFQNSILVI